ncbi:MAG: 4-hydroxy-tetrahydrodipicolinate reductase [Flavobacteriales bacterium]|jgi:4-hydroxy-tetrahydrodipicolinate reductase
MKIALIGYGKMGKIIERIAISRGHEIVSIYNSQKPFKGNEECTADVAIEFTRPDTVVEHIKTAIGQKLPIVVGTTAWSKSQEEIFNLVSQTQGSLLYASNFSVGVNIFQQLTEKLAQLIESQVQYTLRIEETHHLQKLDAPSGTAVTLAEGIIANNTNYNEWQLGNEVLSHQISIVAHREPDVPGTHEVFATSTIDTITLSHEAHSREGFALGAILGAEFLLGKQGVFTMKDVLNLK